MTDAHKKGVALEKAAIRYFNDYQEVSEVYPWREWAHQNGLSLNDFGIDLVVIRHGEAWGVQCKNWERPIDWGDLGSFVGALSDTRLKLKGGYLCGAQITRNAAEKLLHIGRPVVIIPRSDLAAYLEAESPSLPQLSALSMRPYQTEALDAIHAGLQQHRRGKLIMAPGAGKTLVAARLTHRIGLGSLILFCCPSIALLDQSIRAFRRDCPALHACAVVSDTAVGRDEDGLSALAFPATTDAQTLAGFNIRPDRVNVVFATYQSLPVVSDAQKLGLRQFDLGICDEAHHTAGVSRNPLTPLDSALTNGGAIDEEACFKLIHDDRYISVKWRLYMTATPRIFDIDERQRQTLEQESFVKLYDMGDASVYGPTLYEYGFHQAINEGYLAPYSLVVIVVDKNDVRGRLRWYLDKEGAHSVDDATKLFGLAHLINGHVKDEEDRLLALTPRRGLVFVNRVERSKKIAADFDTIYQGAVGGDKSKRVLIRHIDGAMGAWEKNALISWLGDTDATSEVRVLSNAKVLGEGIDVPSLDFVAFIDPKQSVVEVIQALGRVVRRAEGKTRGLVFLPLVISSDQQDIDAIVDRGPYRTLWRTLNAIAAMDAHFLPRLRLTMLGRQQGISEGEASEQGDTDGAIKVVMPAASQLPLNLFAQVRERLALKIVRSFRLGKEFLSDWAAETAQTAALLKAEVRDVIKEDETMQRTFDDLRCALRAFLKDDVSEQDAIDLIVQYALAHPIFDAIFQRRSSIDELLDQMFGRFRHFLNNNAPSLARFYDRVRERAGGLRDEAERQEFLRAIYTDFLNIAFAEVAESLGIAFTPLPLVRFVVRFADHLTRRHFTRGLDDEGVVIFDPFAGVGTFIAMVTAEIGAAKLQNKLSRREIWANEILLLPYMAMSKNIDSAIGRQVGHGNVHFSTALWGDSFRMMEYFYEQAQPHLSDLVPPLYREHIAAQLSAPVNVILSNPPWRGGRKSGNDPNPKAVYPRLRRRIAETYARPEPCMPKLLNALYNTSLQALRMASDRLREGIIGFVMDNGWLNSSSGRGVRRALREEFDEIYVYDLRGDARTSGETRKQEGENVFGQQSRSGVCILIAVRRAEAGPRQGRIYYRAVPDYADLDAKFAQLKADAENPDRIPWQSLTPDGQHDWLAQGQKKYESLVGLDEIFGLATFGMKSNRDRYVWNFSTDELGTHMQRLIAAHNDHVTRLPERGTELEGWIERDPRTIKWDRSLKQKLLQGVRGKFDAGRIYSGLYRPFVPMCAYFDPLFNAQVGKLAQAFPDAAARTPCIVVSGPSIKVEFSVLCCDRLPDYGLLGSTLVYPLYIPQKEGGLLPAMHQSNIDGGALERFRQSLGDNAITPEDVFYYLFGILSTPIYRQEYANDLARSRARVPILKTFRDIATTGRELAYLHLHYADLPPADLPVVEGLPDEDETVQTVYYNKRQGRITINGRYHLVNLPKEATRYRIGSYAPIEWISRYLKTDRDKETGIIWNPNITVGAFTTLVRRLTTLSAQALDLQERLNQAWKAG